MFVFELIWVESSLDDNFAWALFSLVWADFNKIADYLDVQFADDISVEHEGPFEETDSNNFNGLIIIGLGLELLIEAVDFVCDVLNDSGALFLIEKLSEGESLVRKDACWYWFHIYNLCMSNKYIAFNNSSLHLYSTIHKLRYSPSHPISHSISL